MAKRTFKITLGGDTIEVPALNLDQLQGVTGMFKTLPAEAVSFEVIKLALTRVSPAVDLSELAPTLDEVRDAMTEILKSSGIKADPPQLPVGGSP
jgi:hypothetical protein